MQEIEAESQADVSVHPQPDLEDQEKTPLQHPEGTFPLPHFSPALFTI